MSSVSSPGSTTIAFRVSSSPKIEQLHWRGPTRRISCITNYNDRLMDSNAYDALRRRAAYIDLTGRGKLRAVGEDRARLLNAMCTNNIQELLPGTGCYAFFLTAQGRIFADANVFCMPDYLLLDTEPGLKEKLQEHLEKYIIADDVNLSDFTAVTATVNIEGAQAGQVLESLGGPATHIPFALTEWRHRMVAHTNHTGAPGYSIFVDEDDKQNFLDELKTAGLPQADQETVEVVRIENGHPRYGVDFTDSNIPHETQLLHAVHFSKGCYLGQEIVERVRSRGHVNRLLVPLEIEAADAPPAGAAVTAEEKEAGHITSAAFSPARGKVAAIGMIRTEALRTAAALTVQGSPAVVTKRPVLA